MSLRRAAESCLKHQQLHKLGNVFISQPADEQQIFRAVDAADARFEADKPKSPLDGRLVGVKDNICTADLPTTCASGVLKNYTSPFDATVVRRLKAAGAIVAGKTNLDEFGMGSHSTYSYFGPVRSVAADNASRARSVGGSSGGSALAVSTRQCYASLGTDTGGSVRLPAAYTGTVGFKPSYGLVSRWGVVAYANSMDTVGVLANKAKVAREVFHVINGHDGQDPTSLSDATRERIADQARRRKGPGQLKVGVPVEYNIEELDPIVRRAWLRTIQLFERLGHTVVPVTLPATKSALSAYYILAPSEASSNLAKYDGVRYGSRAEGPDKAGPDEVLYSRTRGAFLGEEVKARILLGTFSLSARAIDNYFVQAQKVRRLVQEDFNRVFRLPNGLLPPPSSTSPESPRAEQHAQAHADRVDVLLGPTAPTLPPFLDHVETQSSVAAYTNDVLTVPASLAGLPAISVPVAIDDVARESLPDVPTVGMQIIGQHGDDETVLAVAEAMEEE